MMDLRGQYGTSVLDDHPCNADGRVGGHLYRTQTASLIALFAQFRGSIYDGGMSADLYSVIQDAPVRRIKRSYTPLGGSSPVLQSVPALDKGSFDVEPT
jgi:hypothetical protein